MLPGAKSNKAKQHAANGADDEEVTAVKWETEEANGKNIYIIQEEGKKQQRMREKWTYKQQAEHNKYYVFIILIFTLVFLQFCYCVVCSSFFFISFVHRCLLSLVSWWLLPSNTMQQDAGWLVRLCTFNIQ